MSDVWVLILVAALFLARFGLAWLCAQVRSK